MCYLTMERASIRFFVNPPANNKEAIYAEAVKRAYTDMSRHTLHYSNKKYKGQTKKATKAIEDLKDDISRKLLAYETELFDVTTQTGFDKLHKSMCKSVSKSFTSADSEGIIPIMATPKKATPKKRRNTFSMGQSQKIVNMVWKYVYLFYQYFNAENDSNYAFELERFKTTIVFLHAPIDSYVVSAATKKGSDYYLKCKAPKYSWSQLFYKEYFGFQKQIREELAKSNQHPFIWELENYPFK